MERQPSSDNPITDKVGFGRSQDQASVEPVLLAFTLEPANILAGSWLNIRFLRNTGFSFQDSNLTSIVTGFKKEF